MHCALHVLIFIYFSISLTHPPTPALSRYMDMDPFLYYIFRIGTHFSKPRLRVRKYSAAQPPEVLAKLERWLALDMEVYNWAVHTYKPKLKLYDSWGLWMVHNPFFVLEMALASALLYSCGRVAVMRCQRCLICRQ